MDLWNELELKRKELMPFHILRWQQSIRKNMEMQLSLWSCLEIHIIRELDVRLIKKKQKIVMSERL